MSRTLLFLVLAAIHFSFSARAVADAHSLIRPPLAIKPTEAQLPIPLADILAKKTIGLDFESRASGALALKQAREYVDYRNGGWSRAKINAWSNDCETGLNAKIGNPFCRIEQERALMAGGSGRHGLYAHSEKRSLTESLKVSDFNKAEGRPFAEVVAAVGSVGALDRVVLPLAKKVASLKECVPGTVPTALGYKIEELFPDKDAIELSKTLYRKGLACGKDIALATSAFRLALILVWQKQYAEIDGLMKKVEAIPEAQSIHARAQFWRYQAAIALGNEKAKQDAKDALSKNHPLSFQNLAINGDDEVMMDHVVGRGMPNAVTRSLVRPDVNGILRAAEALEKVGSPVLAAEILDRNVGDLSTIEPEVRLYAAAFLHRMGYSLTKFKILASLFQDAPKLVTRATMELMFPLSYLEVVQRKQKDMDPLLFLSLMRQESAFNPIARSGVGARGLMQLMPATAKTIRRQVNKAQLYQPEINIEVGTRYFLNRLSQYGGDVELTLAAYNAGFARVDQWVRRYPTENKLLFLDLMPYHETRDYVSSILRNYYWYVRLYAPETSRVALETGKISVPPTVGLLTGSSKMQSILAANAGDAARLNPIRLPAAAAVAPSGN